MTISSGNTAFETIPVESLFEAIKSFAIAFDILQNELSQEVEQREFLESVKAALYKPVYPETESSGPISLFEIGIMYAPSGRNAGTYTVNNDKLEVALQNRENDVRALFTQHDGLLSEVTALMTDFLDGEMPEEVYVKARGFLNECLRLEAMF